jgi:DNA transformation protein
MTTVRSLGLGKTMEKKLHTVSIHSAEELITVGSKQAIFRLKAQYPTTCVVILYHLEAAIRGVEIKQLDNNCKSELKAFFNQLL